MPNWKDPATYAFPAPENLRGWAWEFLRRSPVYRTQWLRLLVLASPLIDKHGLPIAEWPKHADVLAAEPDAWDSHPLFGIRELLPVTLGRQWQLECMVDPDTSDAKFLDSPVLPPLWTRSWDVPPFVGGMDEASVAGVYTWIRLDAEIAPQLESLRKALENAKKIQGIEVDSAATKARPDKYPLYVRAFDARAAGVSEEEMVEVLIGVKDMYPDKHGAHKIQYALKEADEMASGGYLSLLAKQK